MVIEDYYTHHMIAASLLRSHLRDLVIYVLLTYNKHRENVPEA